MLIMRIAFAMTRAAPLLFLLVFLWPSFAPAQLGPKDGLSFSPTDITRVKVGDPAPDFILEDMTGKQVSLSDFRGRKKLVLVFYRGHW